MLRFVLACRTCSCCSLFCYADPPTPHSFPTRRSSDLSAGRSALVAFGLRRAAPSRAAARQHRPNNSSYSRNRVCADRKSTRLNSSHLGISYAVFCLKKKKTQDGVVRAVDGESFGLRRG